MPLHQRLIVGYAQFASGLFVVLGFIGVLRSYRDDFTTGSGASLVGMNLNALTSALYLAAGLVGIAMAVSPARSRHYVLAVSMTGLVFGLLEFLIGDGGSDIFGRDNDAALVQIALSLLGLAIWAWTRTPRSAPAGAAAEA